MTRLFIAGGVRRLAREERGLVSVFNLHVVLVWCLVGAVALDFTHFTAAESQLQASADLAAHTALYTSRYGRYDAGEDIHFPISSESEVAAEAAAIGAVRFGMPQGTFGPVLTDADIIIGSLDYDTGRVIPWNQVPRPNPDEPIVYDPKYIDSAAVLTHRSGTSAVSSFLFQFVGMDSVDVNTGAIFTLGPGECDPTQGFFSREQVEMNGNNAFYPGFCVGGPVVRVRNNNTFRPGVSVVTPLESNLDLSNSDVNARNPGLESAHQYGSTVFAPVEAYMDSEMALVETRLTGLPTDLTHFAEHGYAYQLLSKPGWTQVVTPAQLRAPVTLAGGTVYTPSQLTPDTLYTATCTGSGPSAALTLRDDTTSATFHNLVILTNCRMNFDGAAQLEDVVLSSTRNTGRPSFHAPSSANGLMIGRDDDCDPEGGAALITPGIIDVAAKANFFGAILRAGDRIDFQSNAYGEGVSIIAGNGKVDTNSNITMSVCGPAAGATGTDVSLLMVR